MKRTLTLGALLFIVVISPAGADWQYTKWGMTAAVRLPTPA
jgi:hypothetical protein